MKSLLVLLLSATILFSAKEKKPPVKVNPEYFGDYYRSR
jgi:hypothetical protein